MIKVFFDASVIFSAIYSPVGGSRKLIELVKTKKIIGITSENIIKELKDNLDKLKNTDIEDVNQFISNSNLLVRQKITFSESKKYSRVVEEKDLHVVAGAIVTKCDYLVTLDRKHLNHPTVKRKLSKIEIVSSKELLEKLVK